jgi:predicted deacylase
MDAITVGEVTARAGEKAVGAVQALELPASTVRLAVAIVNSGRPGPRLVVTAGIHGTEYPPIEAASRLMQTLTPSEITGSVVVFPLVNPLGFEAAAVNTVPLDGLNLNRVFPGDPRGTPSLVLADFLCTTVRRLADCVIDMHGGDATEQLDPFVICYESGDADVDRRSLELARLYDARHIWIMSARHGHRGTFVGEMSRHGIPAICGEAGYLGTCNEDDVRRHLRGVSNIMRHLGMVPGTPERTVPAARQRIFRRGFEVTVGHAGIFDPLVRQSESVAEGQVLGRVKNIYGDILEEVVAPGAGVVRTLFPKRVVFPGSLVYRGWLD